MNTEAADFDDGDWTEYILDEAKRLVQLQQDPDYQLYLNQLKNLYERYRIPFLI
ncbi:hypothetical protein CLV58_109206 [Spirosoma oryzae]|uniref:Uncharacterized protein n=1 Tax=Spirosoma oryzae TaxID=1469603 RepID=A0A2T0SYL2_9BACT|nr:hypothetical protein [Spirosoma oryzae]PRY38479.1 hypothetical protein CLV58_109206 [Spirosoma oryzae]